MRIKKVYIYWIIGFLLVIFGLYLVLSYLRPLNNILNSLILSIPISFYDIYDIIQFSFGIFYIFLGFYVIFKSEINRKLEILFLFFLITVFITILDYLPLLIQILFGNMLFVRFDINLMPFYMLYYNILILAPIYFQVEICQIIYKIGKKQEFENNFINFLRVFGLFILLLNLDKLFLVLFEIVIISNLTTIISTMLISLVWLSGVVFGFLTYYSFKNLGKDKVISKISILPPISLGIFLILRMCLSISVLDPIQIIIQIVIGVLFFVLALLIHFWKRNLNEKILN